MAEASVVPTTTQKPVEGAPAPKEEGPQYITREEASQIAEDAATKARNAAFAEIRRSTPKPEPKPAEELTLKEEVKQLREERKREREEALSERRDNAINAAVNGLKLDDAGAEMFTALLEKKYGASIKVDGKTVYFEDDVGTKKTVKDLVGDVWKQVENRFTPAKDTPASDGLRGGTKAQGSGAPTVHPFMTKTYKEIMESPRADLRGSFIREHPEQFAAKKTAHNQ